MELTGIRNTRLYGAERPEGPERVRPVGSPSWHWNNRWNEHPLCVQSRFPGPSSPKLRLAILMCISIILCGKNNFFTKVPRVRGSISSMRRAICALGNNEKNQLSAKFAQFPLPLHHSRLRQDHYDQVFASHSSPPGKTNTSIWCNVYVNTGKNLTWFQ